MQVLTDAVIVSMVLLLSFSPVLPVDMHDRLRYRGR